MVKVEMGVRIDVCATGSPVTLCGYVERQVQCGEGGVCLLIFHSTHANEKVAARVLSHTTEPAWSKFCLQRNACEDARDVCATACQGFVFWSAATTHVSGQVAACVMTHTTAPECSQFFPTLLNRETTGHTESGSDESSCYFPFLRVDKKA